MHRHNLSPLDRAQSLAIALARRVAQIRADHFGEDLDGLKLVAEEMSLPPQTWANYEAGVTMPATIMLHFILITGANPGWLAEGKGPMYSADMEGLDFSGPSRN